ncbi:MAG TPA: hypothetical protein VMN99_00785 [Anaerolineales bacterium]|nr:hypothetical protein [Anaerolineales bacterium]
MVASVPIPGLFPPPSTNAVVRARLIGRLNICGRQHGSVRLEAPTPSQVKVHVW